MDELSKTLLTIGAILLLSLATDVLGRWTKLPRVTLLLLFGLLIRQTPWFPEDIEKLFPLITNMALSMVGFLLGEKLALSFLQKNTHTVLWVSVSEVFVTATIVLAGLILIGVPIEVALIFAGISTATDPAATADVVNETNANGEFSSTLLAIVAIDDAWGLIVFSFMLALAQSIYGQTGGIEILLSGAWDLGGACLVGIGLGVPMAYLTGRIRPGKPTLTEALGFVFLCGGIALWLEVSFILASMILGGVVAYLARHHERPFHAIEGIELPFMILFFVLAGASLEIGGLSQIGYIGAAYIILRVVGRVVGAWPGAAIAQAGPLVKKWMGMALMPQAGVALGMALVATHRFPEISDVIFPVVIGTTILFELIGPIMTRTALARAGEIPKGRIKNDS
jgi:Kef-type K+ transport system membrane component KefB